MELKIPNHIAFIMDGNGRWAKKRMMPRSYGHREGVKALKKVIKACNQFGVNCVTVYAFSTENWSRPKDEVNELFGMVKTFADTEAVDYAKQNYRVRFFGELLALPTEVLQSINKIDELCKNNTGMAVNIALNYGSRDEIINALNQVVAKNLTVNKQNIEDNLFTAGLPEPDIIVRSSGEKRLSNFLLWQSAYAELIFIDDFWPDFNKKTVENILKEYSARDRRFGAIK
ncbi:MAG: polyprenyl diphosphate synthase [Clostridia bacterium]